MNFVVTIDLKEKIVLNTEIYPTAEELIRLVSDKPSKLDKQLEQLLPCFRHYVEDNFGCLIEFQTLYTIECHISLQLTLRHFAGLVEAETTFSIMSEEGLVALLKESVKTLAAHLPLPYAVCGQCCKQHKRMRCP